MRQVNEQMDPDVVDDLLASMQVRSTVYCRTDFRAPWGFAVRSKGIAAFHLVTRGSCWLEVEGVSEPVRLSTGDAVLLLTGRAHQVRDDPSSNIEWLDDILERTPVEHGHMSYGGEGEAAELVCGGFILEGANASHMILSMPPLLRLEATNGDAGWLTAFLALLRAETEKPRPGAEAALARLTDYFLTQALRAYLSSVADADQPQVGAMRDPRIAKAIRLVGEDPAFGWTVEDLAADVAMSRSSFAAAFRQLTGESPMRYVTRCRLARAAALLVQTDATLSDLARRTGYESEASLTRAFSRAFGMAPGAFRKRSREPGAARRSITLIADVLPNGTDEEG